MITSRLLNSHFTSILIALSMSLQISACSTADSATTASNIGSGSGTGTDINNAAGINLSWVAPAEREDNNPLSLSEISGYRIYYGETPGQYPSSIAINDGSAEGHIITDLPTGTYYFVVTTYDTAGRESQYSSEVKKVI